MFLEIEIILDVVLNFVKKNVLCRKEEYLTISRQDTTTKTQNYDWKLQ